ncbi:PaRep2b family protein [Thermoproteus tenax Kra 1]|uniref:PaRep2b family protein n=1 Tax=Thermoproteus tenax (strain ATCC 35583 / DSM 2078 / JCM 9277 / NBRC 100435 / Kra 1) TaxID=768679 RepID=G4RLP4_THETK|nr:PaRep2b family protein [Thermoproteus tenax Kra 1]
MEVSVEDLRLEGGSPSARLVVKAGGSAVRFRLGIRGKLELVFGPSARERAEEAARVLRALGVEAEPRQHGGRWRVYVTTNAIASAHPALREAVARAVEAAAERGAVKKEVAEGWLRKLRSSSPPGWPDFSVRVDKGELRVEHKTRRREQMEEVAAKLRALGLAEGTDYRRYPGRYIERLQITPDGVRRLAHIAKHAEDPRARGEAAALLTHLIERARDEKARARLEELVRGHDRAAEAHRGQAVESA